MKTTGVGFGNLDDGSVLIDIRPAFGTDGIEFYGSSYTSIYINTNGLLTFTGPELGYQPVGLAGYAGPAIAPFWSDVDISAGGDIYWDLDPSTGKLTVTWHDVAPYEGTGSNSFQIVLTDLGSGDFEIEYIYEDIQWADGYPTVNAVATAGVTDGGANDTELVGSGDAATVINYDTTDFGGGDGAGEFSLSVVEGAVTCFAAGTRILTARGPRPVERLRVGDMLVSHDTGLEPILWIGRKRIRDLAKPDRQRFRPVLLRKGAAGNHSPLRLSGQHAVLVEDQLIRARHLARRFGGQVARIDRACHSVTYYHLLTRNHCLIKAEGAWAETLYPGAVAEMSLPAMSRAELQHIPGGLGPYGPPVRPYGTCKLPPLLRSQFS